MDISGHQRFKAMANMGINEAQCVIVDLDETQEKALNIAANNQHISGNWNNTLLESILDGLSHDFDQFDSVNFDKLAEDFDFKDIDYSDLDGQMEDFGDIEEVPIVIRVPSCNVDEVNEWLINGEKDTDIGRGRGVLKRCKLL